MTKTYRLDEIDKEILKILKKNCRTPYREIRKELGISIGTIFNRIKDLEKKEIITGYEVKIDDSKIKDGYLYKFLIQIYGNGFDELLDSITKRPEVRSIFQTVGNYRLQLLCKFKSVPDAHYFVAKLTKYEGITKVIPIPVLKTITNGGIN